MLQMRTSVCAVEHTRIGQFSRSSEKGLMRTDQESSEPAHHASCSQWRPNRYPLDCAAGDCVYVTMARLLRTPIVPGTGIRGMSTSPPKYSRVSANVEPT
jgi:hypothetical protein